jgi:GR25 family glycosyltransferase involved in LPS biosynthesis
MNLHDASQALRAVTFRIRRAVSLLAGAGAVASFGAGPDRIGAVIVINLERQPQRWRRTLSELGRFRTADGAPLSTISRRLDAIDARDGRAVAATSDVDAQYRVGDQLFVQPDENLAAAFDADEPVTMTRQEVAVARSHIEAWKVIAAGDTDYVLVLEDDVWFRAGAAKAIDRCWRAALQHSRTRGGPRLLYLSYADAGGAAERIDLGPDLFRPVRGLWFLSGYVLSREGAQILLEAMPVKGPADLWMNYRLEALEALAIPLPAILQRDDAGSDNAYSMLPYLARAGTIDTRAALLPSDQTRSGPIFGWTSSAECEGLAMALSMLGLRVRAFDKDASPIAAHEILRMFQTFDALIDPPTPLAEIEAAVAKLGAKHVFEDGAFFDGEQLSSQTVALHTADLDGRWRSLCAALELPEPAQPFPTGPPRVHRLFRQDSSPSREPAAAKSSIAPMDDTPWLLPASAAWSPGAHADTPTAPTMPIILQASMTEAPSAFRNLAETFPGNLAAFAEDGLFRDNGLIRLVLSNNSAHGRRFRSGAFASAERLAYGRVEAEIRAASGPGLITGFFLHRDGPRQEIDIELVGDDPTRMLTNVYFNPGDAGSSMAYGYRGSPWRVDLGFDATRDFHHYAIEWGPQGIVWRVDSRVVHRRSSWDPTPIPHLPMHLHGNLWAPRSRELTGRIVKAQLPATATFRNVAMWAQDAAAHWGQTVHSSPPCGFPS